MTSRRAVAAGVALVSATLVFCVLLVEVVLRLYAGMAGTSLAQALLIDPYDVLVEPHGERGFRPRPGSSFSYENGTVANINSSGFRGDSVALRKAPATTRVVMLGGSTTFGWGVDDSETIDAYLRDALSDRAPGHSFEVVNLGFDGYDSYQLFERLRSDGVRFDPDIVIVNTGVNDVRNAWHADLEDGDRRTLLYRATMDQLRIERARGGPTLWTRTKHYLYLARLPGWIRAQAGGASAATDAVDVRPREIHTDALDYFVRNLSRIDSLVASGDSVVLLLSTPPSALRTKYEPDDPPLRSYWLPTAEATQVYRDSLDARMRTFSRAQAEAGRVIEYVPHAPIPPELFLDDAHLTPEGNRRVAEAFADAILRHRLPEEPGR